MIDYSAAKTLEPTPPGAPGWRWIIGPDRVGKRMLIKLFSGLTLLLALIFWFDITRVTQQLLAIDAAHVVTAIGLLMLQFVLCCVRWIYILERQNLDIAPRNALSAFGIGTLANLFLVTSIAGMSVRVALLVRSGAGMAAALASVTAERLAAAMGLGICAALGLAFGLPDLHGHFGAWTGRGTEIAVLAVLALLAFGAIVALWNAAALRQFAGTLWLAFSSVQAACLMILVSGASILLGFAGLAMLARGMGLAIDPLFFISVMPAIAFVSALPISVGGWGVREGAMVAGLTLFSVPADTAIALSISYGLGGLLVALTLGTLLAFMGEGYARGGGQESMRPV